jgi:hypothetical protein
MTIALQPVSKLPLVIIHLHVELQAIDNVLALSTLHRWFTFVHLLPAPDVSFNTFCSSVQHQFVTLPAPRGGWQPSLTQQLR